MRRGAAGLRATANTREQYDTCKRVLTDTSESNVRRAWAFLVCGTIGFAGHPTLAHGWSQPDWHRLDLANLPAKVQWWHTRLQQVRLENRPWQEIVEYVSPGTFFACDPPYFLESCGAADRYYQHRMGMDAPHVELIERLRRIKGYCLLCGYHHPLYTQFYFHWRRIKFTAREAMGSRVGTQGIAWLDYEDDWLRNRGKSTRDRETIHQYHGR